MTTDQPTPRELECLRVYLEAGSVRYAAARLDVAEQTVKNHLRSLRLKVRAKNTAQAAYILHDKIVAA